MTTCQIRGIQDTTVIGRLIYLSHIRLDIAYSMSLVSQFMNDLKEKHLQTIYRILHYLKATPKKEILFQKRKELTQKPTQMRTIQDLKWIEDRRPAIALSWEVIW